MYSQESVVLSSVGLSSHRNTPKSSNASKSSNISCRSWKGYEACMRKNLLALNSQCDRRLYKRHHASISHSWLSACASYPFQMAHAALLFNTSKYLPTQKLELACDGPLHLASFHFTWLGLTDRSVHRHFLIQYAMR